MIKKLSAIAAAAAICVAAGAQSYTFDLGKWVEINNAILKELSRSYVDSLDLSRIEKVGISAMLEALDPYTEYVPEEDREDFEMMLSNTYGGIGALIFKPDVNGPVIINEPYENFPASKSGLVSGDEILFIDGVSTDGLTSSESSERMRGKPGTTVKFKVRKLRSGDTWKAGDIVDVDVVRERIVLPAVEYVGMLDDGTTGYIMLSRFTDGVGQQIREGIIELQKKGMTRLVLDLRGNGGGLLSEAVNIVSLFVPKGSVVVTAKGRSEGSDNTYKTYTEPVAKDLPLLIMVDSASASASEIVSGALQDYDRATIAGTRTYGKGLVQSVRPLPYNGQLKVTTSKYYTPSGRCVQAIDYSHRQEDGSVGHIPDSLTREFTTAHGRKVRDGGGITPDYIVEPKRYSRLTYSVVLSGIVEQYALEYVKAHSSIPEDFHFTDYDGFVSFALGKEFDYRTSAKAQFDSMKKTLEEDGLAETMAPQLSALEASLDMDKETFLRLKKDEIIPFIEEEIVVRYYYQKAGIRLRLRYDDQLREALSKPAI